jgi:hypothetical protein
MLFGMALQAARDQPAVRSEFGTIPHVNCPTGCLRDFTMVLITVFWSSSFEI